MKRGVSSRQPILEQVPHSDQASYHFEVVQGHGYGAQWHFHPEYQITLVLKSRGYRIVGDSMESLAAGDLVLVGSNLPHVWYQDQSHGRSLSAVHAIVIRFMSHFLGEDFLQKPEMESVRSLLQRSGRGLQVTGSTRSKVEELLKHLVKADGLRRVIGLLEILEVLAHSQDLRPLSSPQHQSEPKDADDGRLRRVLTYIHANIATEVDRQEAASHASLSQGAFSRFFKTRTGRTLPQYVNELRIGRACSLLAKEDAKVLDIALDCGFENLANFNRQFRRTTKMTPTEWRKEFQRHSVV